MKTLTLFATLLLFVPGLLTAQQTASDLIYDLALAGCSDNSTSRIEAQLIDIGPEAELALQQAVDNGPTSEQLAKREESLSNFYREKYGSQEAREAYTIERLKRMHCETEETFLDYRMTWFDKKYRHRAEQALENLQYARENNQGFWKQELYADAVSGDVAVTAFPNPFRDRTTVQFTTAASQRVEAIVYDMRGRQVAKLFSGLAAANQPYSFEFAPADLGNGTYLFRVTTETSVHTSRLVLAR